MVEILCENLFFKYPNSVKSILNNTNLRFSSGEIIGLVGLNGSGKTTLLKLISGILNPTQGKVTIDNIHIKNIKFSKNYLNLVPENAKLFLIGPTVLDEFLHFFKEKNEVETFLQDYALFDLLPKKLYELSEGQRRLIAILSALVQKKEIFLLDEPTIGLDSNGRKILITIINHIKKNNGTVIIATNDTRILTEFDRLVCLKDGAIVLDNEPKEILKSLEGSIGIVPNQVSRIISYLQEKNLKIPNITTINEINEFLHSLED